MIFKQSLPHFDGLFEVQLEMHEDSRGWFAEAFNRKAWEKAGLDPAIDQVNFSTSREGGTFRGLHYQIAPFAQTKTVFCVRGRILDVVVDLRPGSPTYLKHYSMELHHSRDIGIRVPPGFAHGWYSIYPDSQIMYLVKGAWSKEHERGVRWDDPTFGITLPGPVYDIQDRDKKWPLIRP